MPRSRQRGRLDSTTPRVSCSYSESGCDDHSSEAAHTPASSDEHPSPSHKSLRIDNAGPRTLDQIVKEAILCIASLRAFSRDDPASDQLTERLNFLRGEYQKVQKGDHINDWSRGIVDDVVNEHVKHDSPYYHEYYGGLPPLPAAFKRVMGHPPLVRSEKVPFVSTASSLSGPRFATRTPSNVAGSVFGRHLDSRVLGECNFGPQSLSHADTVAPARVENMSAPLADKDGDQHAEQHARKKWSTVKAKVTDKKSDVAYADRSDLHVEDQYPRPPYGPWVNTPYFWNAEEGAFPQLKTFSEVQRQLHGQIEHELPRYNNQVQPRYNYHLQPQAYREVLPRYPWSNPVVQHLEVPSSSSQPQLSKCSNGWKNCGTCAACTSADATVVPSADNAADQDPQYAHLGASAVNVHMINSSLLKDGVTIADVPTHSDINNIQEHTDTPVIKDGVVSADISTPKHEKSTTTVADDGQQVTAKTDDDCKRVYVLCEDDSDSDSENVPVIPKLGHRKKLSNVKTATGFASSHNPAAPDDSMVGEFLEVADHMFTRDEAFEILRMCGANLVAAVSMYNNARDPEHLRQMLRAWLAPLENAESEAWGISSEKEVDAEEDERQSTSAVMDVRDAFMLLGISAYNSVDTGTLQKSLGKQLDWQEGFPPAQRQLQQAFDIIVEYQNDNDCWKLCPAPWTKAMDEKLMRWKTEDVKIRWAAIASSLGLTVQECKARFKALKPLKETPDPAEEKQSRKPEVKISAHAASPGVGGWDGSSVGDWSLSYCNKCDAWYHESSHDCEAGLAASGGNYLSQNDPAPSSFSGQQASTPKPEAFVPTSYTVTYWATIESGDKIVHVPIDSSNVSGTEKDIIEGSAGMKKVWKWVQEKGLSDKVSLQDAFDLAKDMHGKDEDDKSDVEEHKSEKATSRANSAWGRATSPSPLPADCDWCGYDQHDGPCRDF